MKAAEAGIWQATHMRKRLAEAGLVISAGKMSSLWSGTPTTIRLDDLEILCAVLDCTPSDLLVPTGVPTAGRAEDRRAAGQDQARSLPGLPTGSIVPRAGKPRTSPPL